MTDRIREFIEQNLMIGQDRHLSDDDELLLGGVIDSLGITRLIAFIGNDLGVQVPARDATIDNFRTLTRLTRYLEERMADVET